MTQSELALRVGLHRNTLRAIELGTSVAQPEMLESIARALGVESAHLEAAANRILQGFEEDNS